MLEDPFERDLLLAPLPELRGLLLVDFGLAFAVFDFDDDFALFGVVFFRDLGFGLVFVWAIVPLLAAFPWIGP